MGQLCAKSQLPSHSPWDASTLLKEVERNQSILKLQETEVAQQSHKAYQLLQQVSFLLIEARHFSSSIDRFQELNLTLVNREQLEKEEEEITLLQKAIKKCKSDCQSVKEQLNTLNEGFDHVMGTAEQIDKEINSETESIKTALTGIHNELTKSHRDLKRVEEELTTLRKQKQLFDSERLHNVQKRTILFESTLRIPIHWVNDKVLKAFLIWKVVAASPRIDHNGGRLYPLESVPNRITLSYSRFSEMSDDTEESEFQIALSDEAQFLVQNNPLTSQKMEPYIESATPLDRKVLVELLSEIFIAKTEDDEVRLQQGKEPALFPAFVLTYFSTAPNGSMRAAEIVRSVAKFRVEEDKIGLLWSALLHLSTSFPALTQLSKNITLFYAPFQECAAKWKPGKTVSTAWLLDRVYISDALTLVTERFANDPKSGEEMMTLMKPAEVSDLDFTCFKLMHRMKQIGVDSLGLFRYVDRAGRGKVEIEQLARGIRECLGVWVPEAEVVSLLKNLDSTQSGEVSRLKFMDLSYKLYYDRIHNELYTISLQSLLLCIAKTGFQRALAIIMELKGHLWWSDDHSLDRNEFKRDVQAAFLEYTDANIAKMWKVALSLAEDASGRVSGIVALRVLLRYPPSKCCNSMLCKLYIDSDQLLNMKLTD